MTETAKRNRRPHQISVRGETYKLLKARASGESVSPIIERLIVEYLDAVGA